MDYYSLINMLGIIVIFLGVLHLIRAGIFLLTWKDDEDLEDEYIVESEEEEELIE